MKKVYLLCCFLVTVILANDSAGLLQLSQKNHLEPIPKSKLELLKLIENPKSVLTQEKIELGKMLFFDPRLSKSNLISCNTCHNLGMGGVDGISHAIGHKWAVNPLLLNSPTVYNAVFAFSQLWNGKSSDLADQARGPVHADFEMASSAQEIEEKLKKIQGYKKYFQQAYGSDVKINFDLVVDAIAAFEATLVTPSRFDEFLLGNINALNENEKEGLRIFIEKRCAACHKGVGLGGAMKVFRHDRYTYSDLGDFRGNDNKLVKVPTLRNITQTAPYFHNGAVWNLKDAIYEMAKVQLNIKISSHEADRLVDFLKTLDGKKPQIQYPMLPY